MTDGDSAQKLDLDAMCMNAYYSLQRLGCLSDAPTHVALKELRDFAKEVIESIKDERL